MRPRANLSVDTRSEGGAERASSGIMRITAWVSRRSLLVALRCVIWSVPGQVREWLSTLLHLLMVLKPLMME